VKLLLLGTTGSPFYEHCKREIVRLLEPSKRVGVVTAASLYDEEGYFRNIDERLIGNEPRITGKIDPVRWDLNPIAALDRLDAVIIPGGNIYAL
jgi:hypothetical protein